MEQGYIVGRFRRGVSAHSARRMVAKASQKTKVRAIISQLGFAGNALTGITIATASDTSRANYFDVAVKPFSHIDVIHLDIAIYQSGASIAVDGFVDWAVLKNPAGSLTITNPNGTGLTNVPYTFKTGRAAVPMLTATGIPTIYHLSGDIKIPPRFRVMTPGDSLVIYFNGLAGTGVTYSVNGVITYMFKV